MNNDQKKFIDSKMGDLIQMSNAERDIFFEEMPEQYKEKNPDLTVLSEFELVKERRFIRTLLKNLIDIHESLAGLFSDTDMVYRSLGFSAYLNERMVRYYKDAIKKIEAELKRRKSESNI